MPISAEKDSPEERSVGNASEIGGSRGSCEIHGPTDQHVLKLGDGQMCPSHISLVLFSIENTCFGLRQRGEIPNIAS